MHIVPYVDLGPDPTPRFGFVGYQTTVFELLFTAVLINNLVLFYLSRQHHGCQNYIYFGLFIGIFLKKVPILAWLK
jgi:hypothetical protein